MLTDSIQLTDTPDYDLLWYQVPETVSRADTVIMMFSGFGAEEDFGIENTEPEVAEEIRRCAEKQAKEEKLLKELPAKAKTRDIYFVIPFYSEDGPFATRSQKGLNCVNHPGIL